MRLKAVLGILLAIVACLLCGGAVLPGWGGGVVQAQTQQPATTTAETQPESPNGTYTLPPEKLKQAVDLAHKRLILSAVGGVWGVVVLVLLLQLGAAAKMRDMATGLSANRWVQGFTFFFLFLAVTSVLSLPEEMAGHHLSVEYAQSVQRWPGWFADWMKSFGLSFVIGGLLVMLLFWVIRKSPQRWWFWFWIPAMLSVLFGVFVAPVFIDPMFNHFSPLEQSDPALVSRLEQVVQRGGIVIPPDRMFLMKASEKVTGLNAYVTGIGASKRVVVWDTTIAKATPDEISFIFGHEMGHYVLNHIYLGLTFTSVLLLVSFWLGYVALQWLLERFGKRWRIGGQQDWAALVPLMLVVSVVSFFFEPVANGFSRWEEHVADVYGQEAIHGIVANPQATAVDAFRALGESYLDDPNPNPLVEFWTYSHPSITRRMAFAAKYDPWLPGRHPRYFEKNGGNEGR